jgi:hypothetical protein
MNLCYIGRDNCLVDADCASMGANWGCPRDLDGRNRCVHFCERDADCAPVPGTVCHWGMGVPTPAGFCLTPGPKAAGMTCDNGLECQSLACTSGGPVPTCANGVPGFPGGDAGVVAQPDASAPQDATVDAASSPDASSTSGPDALAIGPSDDDAGPLLLAGGTADAGLHGGCSCGSTKSTRSSSNGLQVSFTVALAALLFRRLRNGAPSGSR